MATKLVAVMLVLFLMYDNNVDVSAQCNDYTVVGLRDGIYDSCICDVQVGSIPGCTNPPSQDELDEIEYIQHRVTNISVRVDMVKVDIETTTTEIDITQADLDVMTTKLERIESGELKVNRPEFDLILEEIGKLEQVLVLLEVDRGHNLETVTQLETELTAVERLLFDLKKTQDVETLLEEIEELEDELAQCKANVQPTRPPGSGDDYLFVPWDDIPNQDSCAAISSVSSSYTVRSSTANGVWMRDPYVDPDKIWHYQYHTSCTSSSNYRYINRFNSYESYERNVDSQSFNLGTSYIGGPGMVAYNGSIYFTYYNSRIMYRHDVALSSLVISRSLDGAGYGGNANYEYMGRGCSDIDFAVDENGLWVIYATSSTVMKLSYLNHETLEIIQTWSVNFAKNGFGNCFVICAKLYCTSSYVGMNSKISFMFDTKTGVASSLDIGLGIRYGRMYTLDYNPRDQKLYGWDYGKMVVYDLTFGTSSHL